MALRSFYLAIIPKSGYPNFINSPYKVFKSLGEWAKDIPTAVACFTINFKFSISSDVIADISKFESGKFRPLSDLIFAVVSEGYVISNSIYSSFTDFTLAPIFPSSINTYDLA